MPFSGGTFSRLYSWVSERDLGNDIDSTKMDAEDDGIATGLSTCICRDGQSTITDNIPFNSKKITGLGDATADTDALNRQTADARYFELAGGALTVTSVSRSGDTFTALSDPASLPAGIGNRVQWSADSNYLSVGMATTPYIFNYSRSGSTFTALSNPSTLPAGTIRGLSYSPVGVAGNG